jgi:RNA polymerase sigma-70 factor (ECF subfamily)
MTGPSPAETTAILRDLVQGDTSAADRLWPLVYDELHGVAERYFRRERPGHTLQPTALVHEAYLRLVDQSRTSCTGRAHFIALAAKVMRQLLVDRARRHKAVRHGGQYRRISLSEVMPAADDPGVDVLALDEVLRGLADIDARASRVVELRFFGGLSIDEAAEVLGVARSTVTEDWRLARAWLISELRKKEEP